ncbi:right-handed parallel beta-helix repeat-containing protein [Faecalibacterium taiwanense]|uniref:right-handed parallel beta-helix repeat-containing protein n=1 Tax=Faecalibacterium taiwanense TaxID=3030638 RepID=UPI003AADF32D
MMFQMLPMMAFADEGAGSEGAPSDVTLRRTGKSYSDLQEAVKAAESGDTIELGVGDYTLYKVDSTGMTRDKDLTFVGKGTDKTTWYIGAYVTDPNKTGEYTGDYCFDGAGTVTFENMTLRSGPATDTNAKLGFIRPDNTVVDKCEIVGWTAFWGYDSAVFKNTTFKPIEGKDAIWVYSSKEATFDDCTFTAGRAVKVYTEENKSVTVNFNNCTVENSGSHPAIYIDEYVLERDGGTQRYNINITGNNHVKAQTNTYTCSKLFGFRTANAHPGHFTNVSIDGKLVWSEGKMLTHDYTDGQNEPNLTTTPAAWTEKGSHYEREVTTTCNYCGYTTKGVETGYKLAYDLNGGVAAAGADYTEKIVAENETVKLAAAPAPAQEGVYFLGWEDESGKQYNADATITLTANTKLTAQWGDVPPVEPAGGGSGDGGAGVVVAGALLGGAGYLLGTRLWLESTFGFVPANRIELAMALWKRADCPAPVSTELYPDIDEDDTDAQAAARWCVEQDLMEDFARTNSDGTQTVKFKPYDYVFRPQSLVKWYKLEKLLNEQQSTNA